MLYMQFRLTNSQRYLVVGLAGYRSLLPLGLVLWLVPGLAFTKYRCEFVSLNCIFTKIIVATGILAWSLILLFGASNNRVNELHCMA